MKCYILSSIVVHYGVPHAGHYVTYANMGKDLWYLFDDASVCHACSQK